MTIKAKFPGDFQVVGVATFNTPITIPNLTPSLADYPVGACLDGNGTVLDTTWEVVCKSYVAGTIVAGEIGGTPSGSITVDVYKAAAGAFGTWTKISASAPLTLSSATDHTDTTLAGWTTAIASGDWLRFVVTSATAITRAVPVLKVLRS